MTDKEKELVKDTLELVADYKALQSENKKLKEHWFNWEQIALKKEKRITELELTLRMVKSSLQSDYQRESLEWIEKVLNDC